MARRHGALKVRGQWFARWTCTEGHEHRKLAQPENTAKEARDLAGTKRKTCARHGTSANPAVQHWTRLPSREPSRS